MPEDRYTHGHHASVLRSHTWRTAENSAGYLRDRLRPGLDLLDVGCGPGTITRDFGILVAPGRVIGIDSSAEVIAEARALASPGNVEFAVEDIYALSQTDETFDVVHAHQVLQHLSDPVSALLEMHRVLRSGGIVAVRDADHAGIIWAPKEPALERWMELYHEITTRNGAEADAGRYLLSWVRKAGFEHAIMTSSTWTFADPETRSWWGSLWAERVSSSLLAQQALDYGLSHPDELDDIANAFLRWAAAPDSTFIIPHGEVIAVKGR